MDIAIPPGLGQPGDSFDPDQEEKAVSPAELATGEPSASSAPREGHWQAEDRTFHGSDIVITIVLFRPDGHPDGRLVHIIIKDFHETAESGHYRERQLTESSSLDRLQANGINEVFQRFWFRLEEQRKKAAAVAARQKAAPATVGKTTAPPPATAPPPPVAAPAPRVTAPPRPVPTQTQTQHEFF